MSYILIKTKVQKIYYQTPENELGIAYETKHSNIRHERITLAEAEDILLNRKIAYDTILKVVFEDIEMEIPDDQFENFIVEV